MKLVDIFEELHTINLVKLVADEQTVEELTMELPSGSYILVDDNVILMTVETYNSFSETEF